MTNINSKDGNSNSNAAALRVSRVGFTVYPQGRSRPPTYLRAGSHGLSPACRRSLASL